MNALLAALALVVAQTDITFQWAPPPTGAPAYYKALIEAPEPGSEVIITTEPSVTVSLPLGQDVSLRVSACNFGACGAWSPSSQQFSLNFSADATGDSAVGIPDFPIFFAEVGFESDYDLSGDGVVGLPDLTLWREKIGECIGNVYVNGARIQAYLPCDTVLP